MVRAYPATDGRSGLLRERLPDPDVVPRRVPERAIEHAVALLDRLLQDLGARVADTLERRAAVVGAEDDRAHRALGDQRAQGLGVLRGNRRRDWLEQADLDLGLVARPDG